MKVDIRTEAAKYYDCSPNVPDDIPFYINHIPSQRATVLALGCGTGRVTLALAQHCRYIHSIDLSESMISICQGKLIKANIPLSKAKVEVGDITDFDLEQTFDLIIAPLSRIAEPRVKLRIGRIVSLCAQTPCSWWHLHTECLQSQQRAKEPASGMVYRQRKA